MRPLNTKDVALQRLTRAIAEARKQVNAPRDWPAPSAREVVALCNAALKLCVARYEGEPLSTSLLLFDAATERHAPGFLYLPTPGPDWKALARGFPRGLAVALEKGHLRAFAGLTIALPDTHELGLPVVRAQVLPGVVGVTVAGELLAELRPGEPPHLLAAPRPSFDALLREAGLDLGALLQPATLRRLLQAARGHHHGATVVVSAGQAANVPDTTALAGATSRWTDLEDALNAAVRVGAESPGNHLFSDEVFRQLAALEGISAPSALDARASRLRAELVRENGAAADQFADALGQLTAVDGALALDHDGQLLGFGLRLHAPPPRRVHVRYSDRLGDEPFTRREDPATGSRRRSAVDYVTAHPDCFVLVLSSDGPLSLVSRDAQGIVLVQRGLECLL